MLQIVLKIDYLQRKIILMKKIVFEKILINFRKEIYIRFNAEM